MILDCGLMFPDIEMPGVDLVLPDFTYLRENADRVEGCIVTHGHEDHCGGLSFLLRELSFPIYGSALTLGLARSRIEEAGLLEPDRAHPGARRRAAPDRALRRGVHPGHPLGAPRLRHRLPHPAGRHPALRRLQDRPDPGRRAVHRPGPDRGPGRRARGSGCSCPTRPTPRRRATPTASAGSARCWPACSPPTPTSGSSWPASPATSTASSRSPTPPSANGRIVATLGRSMGKNVALARSMGLLHIPDDRPGRHRADRRPRPPPGLRHLDRLAGRAHVGPGPDGGGRQQVDLGRRRRPGRPVLPRHPRQRDQRRQGHRRAVPAGRRGHPLRPGAGPRERARQAGGAEDAAVAGPPGVLHPGPRRVPAPDPPRPAGPGHGRGPANGCCWPRTAT